VSTFGRIDAAPAGRDAYLVWARTRVHRERVERARESLRRAAEIGPLAVSSSWGKDSTAMCHIAVETLGRVPIVHMASSYRLPGWERVADYFAARTDAHEIPAERTLAETIAWLRTVGLGYEREGSAQRVTNRAKRDRAGAWAEAHGVEVQAMGLRAEESRIRRGLLLSRGAVYTRRDGMSAVCPLAWWTSRDVWAYLYSREIPYHPLYDCETHGYTRETLRNTGWLTTIDAPEGRIAWLRAHFPAQYRMLVAEFPRVAQLS
jgi:phosphoadenosine phosphosulfate reductase